MNDILIAADEAATNSLVTAALSTFGSMSNSGTSSLGPFDANWTASASLNNGSVGLREPDVVRMQNMVLDFTVGIGLSIDLSDILPNFCLPQVCVNIPFIGRVCTPRLCIDWPTISVGPISHSGNLNFTSDFRALASLDGPDWRVDIEIVDIPNLQLDAVSALIVVSLTTAVSLALLAVPFIGPFLAAATFAIGALIGIAAVTGLLGPILSLFLSGLKIPVYHQTQIQTVIPSSGVNDPSVKVRIDNLAAAIASSDEHELILTANISPA